MLREVATLAMWLGLMVAGPAIAQQSPSPDAVQNLVGAWELSNADRNRICIVNLRDEAVPAGFRLEFQKDCAEVFSAMRQIAAWTLDNYFLRLVDARGRPIQEFSEVENGIYEGLRPGEGLFFLQNAAAAGPPPRTTDQMAGDWQVFRGNGSNPVCTITLLSTEVPGQDRYAVRVQPRCDPAIARFNPSAWRMDQSEIMLFSPRGEPWRFEEDDPSTYRRIPAGADPLLLVRK